MMTNIADLLRYHADRHPDRPAIIDMYHGKNRVTTFGELEDAVSRAATLLCRSGLEPGDRVLVLQPMSVELYVALIALFRCRMVAMFVDLSLGREQIERCCREVSPRACIGGWKVHLLRRLVPAANGASVRQFLIGSRLAARSLGAACWSSAAGLPSMPDSIGGSLDTPALLTFTSGSTGRPKAMLRTHGFLLAQHRVLADTFPCREGSSSLTSMPIFVLADLACGITSLIAAGDLQHPGRIDPQPILEQIHTYRPVRASGSPAFWERIASYCEQRHMALPPGLQALYAGGGPVFPPLLDRLAALAPEAEVVSVYGGSEAEPIARMSRAELSYGDFQRMRQGGGLLAGVPVPEIDLRIVADPAGSHIGSSCTAAEFAAHTAAPGEPGEIVVSGEHVSTGYLHGSADQEAKFRVDGRLWHRTGDSGYLDSHGRLWLLGRSVARIRDRRGTLYPFAVECALSWNPGVRRAAAIAFAGRRLLLIESPRHVSRTSVLAGLPTAAFDAVWIWHWRRIPVDKRHNAKIDYAALSRLLERENHRHISPLLVVRVRRVLAYVYHEASQTAKRAKILSPLRLTWHQPQVGVAGQQSPDGDSPFEPSQGRSQTDMYAGTEA
jgi:acyl-CoA synthetase (AMP-forming)/AMP-acid ligase II